MNLGLLIFEFMPLIAYLVVDYWKGFRAGIYAAIVASGLVLGYDYVTSGEWDPFVLGEVTLIVGLGLVSLKMNSDRWFKFQPTVVGAVFALVFAYFQIIDKPLINQFIPHLEKLMGGGQAALGAGVALSSGPEQDPLALLRDPRMQEMLASLSRTCIWLFFGHACVMAYAALRLSTGGWFAWRLAIYPAMIAAVVIHMAMA